MFARLLFIVGCWFFWQHGAAQTDLTQVNIADSLANMNKLDLAEQIYRAELAKDSSCWRCYFGLAGIETLHENHAQAAVFYTQALSFQHRSFIYQRRAQSYYYLENMDAFCADTDSALAIYSRVDHELQPEEQNIRKEMQRMRAEVCDASKSSYYIHRGLAALNRKDSAATADAYATGIARFPDDAALRNFQGNFFRIIGEETKARENYLFVLAHLDNLNSYLKSSAGITDPIQIELFVAETRLGLAATYFREGNFDEAEKIMGALLAKMPDAPDYAANIADFYNFYGEIWLNKGVFNKAKSAFEQALALDKTYSVAYANYALTILTEELERGNSMRTFRLKFGLSQQGQQFSAAVPIDFDLKVSDGALVTALSFINKAIKITADDPDYYWIRGDIKYILGMSDYCLDYQTAKAKGNPAAQLAIDERCK